MDAAYHTMLGKILNSYSSVNKAAIALVAESGTVQALNKGVFVFEENKFNGFEYFQLGGVSHRFNTDEDLQNITTGIYSGDTVITPHFSRTRNGKSIFSLETLTECVFFKVPIGAFNKLREENEELGTFGQRVVQTEFIRHLNYEVLFRSRSAKERLLYFRSAFPGLENLIPLTTIASFLGITPVSFSRLRNELAKNKV